MKKKIAILALLGYAAGITAQTSDYRAPLSVIEKGYIHFWSPPVEDMWWFDAMGLSDDECCQPGCCSYQTWFAYFGREAGKSFLKNKECKNGTFITKNSVTTETTSLGYLIFNSDRFKIVEGFAGGGIDVTDAADVALLNNTNPFINVFRVTPDFEYKEKGVVWGVRADCRFGKNDCYYAGARVSVPFKIVEIEHIENCTTEETLSDVVRAVPMDLKQVTAPDTQGTFDVDLTARLDFLSSIDFNNLSFRPNPPDQSPFITYGDGSGEDVNETKVYQVVVTDNDGLEANVLFVRETSGNAQDVAYPFRKIVVSADPDYPAVTLTPLAADGSGGGNGDTLFMTPETDYKAGLGVNNAAQTQLFMVLPTADVVVLAPNDDNDNGSDILRTPKTTLIRDALVKILSDLAMEGDPAGPSDFLCDQGLNLNANERKIGIGDIDAALFVGVGHRWDWFIEGLFGVRFPTGTKQKDDDVYHIYQMETGNNRHWEVGLGIEGGWKPLHWFAFSVDATFNHVFPRNQVLLGTFEGATITGLGGKVDGKISWNYFTAHADFTFFHPCNPELGFVVGYELFAKKKDHVEYCQETAKDFLGRTGTLDPTIAEKNTNALLNKLRVEVFNRWNFFELFAGASTSIAGRHAMKETEAHLGFVIYF